MSCQNQVAKAKRILNDFGSGSGGIKMDDNAKKNYSHEEIQLANDAVNRTVQNLGIDAEDYLSAERMARLLTALYIANREPNNKKTTYNENTETFAIGDEWELIIYTDVDEETGKDVIIGHLYADEAEDEVVFEMPYDALGTYSN